MKICLIAAIAVLSTLFVVTIIIKIFTATLYKQIVKKLAYLQDDQNLSNNFNELKPIVNEEIQQFLEKKLPQKMPMIGMLIGERTTQQLKDIFLEELSLLFPQLAKSFIQQQVNQIQIKNQSIFIWINKLNKWLLFVLISLLILIIVCVYIYSKYL